MNVRTMLERIENNAEAISEVLLMPSFSNHYEGIEVAGALATIRENINLVLAEYEDEDLVVIRLVNEVLVINFGNPGAGSRYVNWALENGGA
jgi:hypothetical protein